jgi:hypothetical protein
MAAIAFWAFLGIIGWLMLHTLDGVLIFIAMGIAMSFVLVFLKAIRF